MRQLFTDRVLEFVAHYQRETRISPTQQEIARGTGIKSHGSVWRALEKLKAEGRIDRVRTQITILHMSMTDAD